MSDLSFENRVAVITGAGGGLGRQHALLLASRGASVVINDLGGAVDGSGGDLGRPRRQRRRSTISAASPLPTATPSRRPKAARPSSRPRIDAFGRIDIVINNAGILRDKTFHNMTESAHAVIDVHLKGAFNVTRPAFIKMREQSYGRIVNTSSNSGILGNFGQANYGAAKMGLVGFTRVLAAEGAKYNIKANALAPVARTRMTEDLLGPLVDKLDPGLVSPVVAWLVHEDCPVTGEIYSAAGGRVVRFFIGMTEGYFNPALTVEDVRDQFDHIRDTDGYTIPAGPGDELKKIFEIFS